MTLPYAEPYKIKMTEAIRTSTRAERETWIREASYNLFKLRSDQVDRDLIAYLTSYFPASFRRSIALAMDAWDT